MAPPQDAPSPLHLQSVAHMIGDTFIKNRSEEGQSLEGHSMSATIPYLQVMLGRVLDVYGAQLDERVTTTVKELIGELTPSLSRCMDLEHLAAQTWLEGDIAAAKKRVEDFASKLMGDLNALKEGDTLALPWGWVSTDSGHAMLLSFKRLADQQWRIEVLNTGAGMQFATSVIEESKQKRPFLTIFDNVTDQELLDSNFLERMVEPCILIGDVLKGAKEITSSDLYLAILEKQLGTRKVKISSDKIDIDQFITGQRSGSCALRVLLALLRLRLGKEDYKRVKHLLHLESAKAGFFVEREAFKSSPTRRRMLQEGLQNIARQALKLYRQGLVSRPEFRTSAQAIRELSTEMRSWRCKGEGAS